MKSKSDLSLALYQKHLKTSLRSGDRIIYDTEEKLITVFRYGRFQKDFLNFKNNKKISGGYHFECVNLADFRKLTMLIVACAGLEPKEVDNGVYRGGGKYYFADIK